MLKLKFRKREYSGIEPRILFSVSVLCEKPIYYFATMISGSFPKGKLNQFCKTIKNMVGYKFANPITYFTFGRMAYPYHIQILNEGKAFEMTIWGWFGRKPIFKLSRKLKSKQERFTWEEVKKISDTIQDYHYKMERGVKVLDRGITMQMNIDQNPRC